MPTPILPSVNNYGLWQIYFAEKIKDKLAKSTRDFLGPVTEFNISIGRFNLATRWPHVYIIHARHNIEEANVSGGKLHAQWTYDVIVENSHPSDLDRAEKEAILVLGDVIAELHTDPHLLVGAAWTARGMSLEFLEPVYPLDPATGDLYVQVGLRVVILKSMQLV